MQTAAKVKMFIKRLGVSNAAIDTVGVGGGVYDRLVEENEPVMDMQAAGRAKDYKTYSNARAEWYWTFRERLEQGDVDLDPEDEDTIEQLAGMQFKIDNRGRIQIESKDDMKKRGMDSPDRADAMIMSFSPLAEQDWGAAYGVIACLSCDRVFLESSNPDKCPHCNSQIG